MTIYTDLAALADELLVEFGFDATIQADRTASDPVTGIGGGIGATRTVRAVLTGMDFKTFPETLVQSSDRMMILGGPVKVGEFVSGFGAVKEVRDIQPDNATHIITKALIRG